MKLTDFEYLYNISHIDNLDSIMENGILSHNKVKSRKLNCTKIWDPNVQQHRAIKRVPGGSKLHSYANLYFNPRNAMMSRLRELNDELCIIVVDKKIIRSTGVVITDMNAAASYVRFYTLNDIHNLDATLIFAKYWTHPNPIEQDRRKKIVCAEALVPEFIPAKLIKGVIVYSQSNLKKAKKILSKFSLSDSVIIDKDLFF